MNAALEILREHAVLIDRDVRPATMQPLQERYIDEARSIVEGFGLSFLAQDLAEGWKEVRIYKYPHIGCVIGEVKERPATVFEHWTLGKLFGYSDDAIAGYLAGSSSSGDFGELGAVALRAGRKRVGRLVEMDQLSALIAFVRPLARLLAGGGHRLTSLHASWKKAIEKSTHTAGQQPGF